MRSMVEGVRGPAVCVEGPLHRTSCGPPPRPGEDLALGAHAAMLP
jgi:hypothetical protein